MSNFAQQVAEQIDAEAHSGSGFWDELNGPSATLQRISDDKFTISFPQQWDADDQPTGAVCLVTVEMQAGGPS